MVFAAQMPDAITDWDDSELLDIRWFSEAEVQSLKQDSALHANYELEAIRALRQKLDI
jgi:NADH pyrophosphatase NudC (nudix superfamily)